METSNSRFAQHNILLFRSSPVSSSLAAVALAPSRALTRITTCADSLRPVPQKGDFAASVALYAESIKRNPADPRGYTNRAAALTKLMALPEALKDTEKAIEVDPDFVKGYIRKSHVLFAMKEYSKSISAIEQVRSSLVSSSRRILALRKASTRIPFSPTLFSSRVRGRLC